MARIERYMFGLNYPLVLGKAETFVSEEVSPQIPIRVDRLMTSAFSRAYVTDLIVRVNGIMVPCEATLKKVTFEDAYFPREHQVSSLPMVNLEIGPDDTLWMEGKYSGMIPDMIEGMKYVAGMKQLFFVSLSGAARVVDEPGWKPPEEKPLVGVKPRPNIYPCGCSHHKVKAGRCDHYDEHGDER